MVKNSPVYDLEVDLTSGASIAAREQPLIETLMMTLMPHQTRCSAPATAQDLSKATTGRIQ